MKTEWQIVFNYKLDNEGSAQEVWDEIFRAALQYRARSQGVVAIEATAQNLTDAIFTLTDHDQVDMAGKTINGQKVKELFITTIFLKYLETRFKDGGDLFLVVPRKETSCDTAIMIAPKEAPAEVMTEKQLQLTPNHYSYDFQIKEHFDFERMQQENLEIRDFDPSRIDKSLSGKNYSELILVYIRDLMIYTSEKTKEFFKKYPNAYLISATDKAEAGGAEVVIDKAKYNFIVSFPDGETMYHAIFDRPKFLVSTEDAKMILGYTPS